MMIVILIKLMKLKMMTLMAGALTYLQLKLGLGATALDLPQPVSKDWVLATN